MTTTGRDPIKILDLRDSPWIDGPGRTILDCAETIDPARFQIIIGAFDGGNPDGTEYEHGARGRGLEVERLQERRSLDLKVLRQVVDAGRRRDAKLIHSHDFRSDIFGFAAAKILGVPHVATVHGWIENDFKGSLSARVDKWILRRADHVIAVSNETQARLGGWATSQRCSVIPNALRVENYQPVRGPGPFRESLEIPADNVVIANIGRLSPEKGQLQFLTAARELLRQYEALTFVLFGQGPELASLERFVADAGISDSVIFAGYRTDMTRIYNEIDLVVQSSFTEGMPNVILEAALMEVPVIATDVGGTREIVVNGESGVLLRPGSYEPIVSSVEGFLKGRAAFESMAKRARDYVARRFDHACRVEQLGSVYERVIAPHWRTA